MAPARTEVPQAQAEARGERGLALGAPDTLCGSCLHQKRGDEGTSEPH